MQNGLARIDVVDDDVLRSRKSGELSTHEDINELGDVVSVLGVRDRLRVERGESRSLDGLLLECGPHVHFTRDEREMRREGYVGSGTGKLGSPGDDGGDE